jgi:hypothetical protein
MDAICAQLEAMPRINSDQVREKISALARTASISNPQINTPLSPVPLSRTSSVSVEKAARLLGQAKKGPILVRMGKALLRHPMMTVAVLTVWTVAALTLAFKGNNVGDAIEAPKKSFAENPAPAMTVRSAVDARPPAVSEIAASPGKKSDSILQAPRSKREPIHRGPSPKKDPIVPKQPIFVPHAPPDSNPIVEPPRPLPPKPQTGFRIGSREEAFLYIDGALIGLLKGVIKYFPHPPGRVHVQIKAEDCMSFDTVLTLVEGDSTVVGWRQPRCGKRDN